MGTSQLLSMTGFGLGEATCTAGSLRVEIRAVNHRNLDVRVKTSAELVEVAALVEDIVRADCNRGRVEVSVKWQRPTAVASGPDLRALKEAHALLTRLCHEVAPEQVVTLDAVVRLAAEQRTSSASLAEDLETSVRQATREALDKLQAMRATEGAALARDLSARAASLRNQVARIEAERVDQLDAYRERVTSRVQRLIEGAGVELDSARLTQEVAWMAERSDVAEELTRLTSHLEQFENSVRAAEGTSVGRKLEFLVQEMGREVNTLGSKASDAAAAHRVVDMKAELDRIREQVANIL